MAVFAALGEVQPKGVLGLDAGEEGMSIDGELIGELTASFDMVDGSWSSVVFDPEVLEDGLATTGQFSGSLGEVREYVQEKC